MKYFLSDYLNIVYDLQMYLQTTYINYENLTVTYSVIKEI